MTQTATERAKVFALLCGVLILLNALLIFSSLYYVTENADVRMRYFLVMVFSSLLISTSVVEMLRALKESGAHLLSLFLIGAISILLVAFQLAVLADKVAVDQTEFAISLVVVYLFYSIGGLMIWIGWIAYSFIKKRRSTHTE